MASSSLSLTCVSTALAKRYPPQTNDINPAAASVSMEHSSATKTESKKEAYRKSSDQKLLVDNCMRRLLLLGIGAASASLTPAIPVLAEGEKPGSFQAFVDREDGYSYYYPSDWREFDFRGHDSAFKDRFRQLQNVRVRFIPTEKEDIREMGDIEEVVNHLVRHVYPAPTQKPTIMSMEERTVNGKNYYTFEYVLTSPNYSSVSFATIAIANGRYYTLIVGANERRWRRFRGMLKVVADSFRILDI